MKSEKLKKVWFAVGVLAGFLLLAAIIILPPHMPVGRHRPYNSCITNLKQLDGAKEQWMLENKKSSNDVVNWEDLIGSDKYVRKSPECPAGGKYTLNKLNEHPVCSIGTNQGKGDFPHILPR